MNTLLVMTVGHTDAQLVANNQRHKFDGNACGTLHDAIKEHSWSVVDAPGTRSRDLINSLPDGEVELCTPKLDAVLAHFGDTLPTSALIFETNRQDARDPRLAGEVVECRLHDRGISPVTRVAFLTGTEQLEDQSNDVDAVIRRTVVATLSDAIRNQVEQLTKNDRVFVATTGGLPAANELINEMVRLYAVSGPPVTALEVPDGDRTQQNDRAVEERFHPAASYRARWHALSLIEKGNLLGAWGAVEHIANHPGQEWTQVVKWLANFASSLPNDDCDISVLRHERIAVRTALRVEFALREGDIPRAIHGTVAFFEAALWDWIRQRDFKKEDEVVSGDSENGFAFSKDPDKEKKKRFRKSGTVWKINDFKPGIDAWLPVLNKPKLSEFWKKLDDDIRSLRNDVAHCEPTPKLMNEAHKSMVQASLWSQSRKFLAQDLVRNVLCELKVPNPDNLCDELIAIVRTNLRKVS